MTDETPFLCWYGERGIVNSVVSHIGVDPTKRLAAFLSAVRWAAGSLPAWLSDVRRPTLLVEWGSQISVTQNLIIVLEAGDGPRCVFLEAKVGPYLSSMMPNSQGMREAGFNSSINGQLALKFRFAHALQAASPGASVLEEPEPLLQQYRSHVGDPRRAPRRLAKPEIVRTLAEFGLLGLSPERCAFVALTWDTPGRAFFTDPFVKSHDGLPRFVDPHGRDVSEEGRPGLGWLGYQDLHRALGLERNAEFLAAWATMQTKLEPDATDYRVAEGAFEAETSPESIAEAASFRELFAGFEIVQSKGSYSVRQSGQTIAKIIPRRDVVFVGIRDTKDPARWFSGPLERVSIQGVPFHGLWGPVEHPEDGQLALLVDGLKMP